MCGILDDWGIKFQITDFIKYINDHSRDSVMGFCKIINAYDVFFSKSIEWSFLSLDWTYDINQVLNMHKMRFF